MGDIALQKPQMQGGVPFPEEQPVVCVPVTY